jgi:hypothetical protein
MRMRSGIACRQCAKGLPQRARVTAVFRFTFQNFPRELRVAIFTHGKK